jgi:hypothetical protein
MFTQNGIRPHVVKSEGSYVIESFFTINGKELIFEDKFEESWNCLMLTLSPSVLRLNDIKHYVKLTV